MTHLRGKHASQWRHARNRWRQGGRPITLGDFAISRTRDKRVFVVWANQQSIGEKCLPLLTLIHSSEVLRCASSGDTHFSLLWLAIFLESWLGQLRCVRCWKCFSFVPPHHLRSNFVCFLWNFRLTALEQSNSVNRLGRAVNEAPCERDWLRARLFRNINRTDCWFVPTFWPPNDVILYFCVDVWEEKRTQQCPADLP